MSEFKLISEKPVFLDDENSRMLVVQSWGRPEDANNTESKSIVDYPDSHRVGEVIDDV